MKPSWRLTARNVPGASRMVMAPLPNFQAQVRACFLRIPSMSDRSDRPSCQQQLACVQRVDQRDLRCLPNTGGFGCRSAWLVAVEVRPDDLDTTPLHSHYAVRATVVANQYFELECNNPSSSRGGGKMGKVHRSSAASESYRGKLRQCPVPSHP